MKCPECVGSNQRSKVYSRGSTSTLMGGGAPFYDEDGEYHAHDPNKITDGWQCSNGHSFAETRTRPCPSRKCEYGKSPEQIAEQGKPECCGGGPQWGHAWACKRHADC